MTKIKNIKRIISIALVLVTILSTFAITASAASTTGFDILSSSKYAKTYTLSSSGKTIPYTSKNLSTRGTVTYGASSSAYIDNSSDEIYIFDVGCTNGKYWAYVSYPTSSKRVNAYVYLSALTKNNGNHNKSISSGKFYCSTRENNSTNSNYYVANGDTVYLIATSSSKYQILYPISGGKWRLAWCNKSDYQKYCTKTTYYTLSYNANGGSGAPSSQTVKANTGFYLSSTKPTRSGYTFLGWSTNKNATSASYAPGAGVKISSNVTLYAVWKKNPTTNSSKTYTAWVNTSSAPLNLRKDPNEKATILTSMPKGSQITVLDNKKITNGFYHVKYNGITGYASTSYITFSKPSTSTSLIWPTSAKYVTCLYYYANGSKHSTRYGYNNAIDIAGGGNIYAAASGTVETVKYQSGGFGNYIVLKHNDGTRTLYAHLKNYSVKQGQYVSQGQTIGVMGSTGNSSGVHLHFEWSGGDPWKTYFKSDNSLKYEYNVRANNSKYNSDKTIVNWIDSNYKYSNGWYVHK
ncbi:MAG: peptidoglycan DD-metalloendopeptidase family protein [Acutalibacteraceae bacterium]